MRHRAARPLGAAATAENAAWQAPPDLVRARLCRNTGERLKARVNATVRRYVCTGAPLAAILDCAKSSTGA